jgi:hypothetical protein
MANQQRQERQEYNGRKETDSKKNASQPQPKSSLFGMPVYIVFYAAAGSSVFAFVPILLQKDVKSRTPTA